MCDSGRVAGYEEAERLEHNPTGVTRGSIRLCFEKKRLERRSDPIRSKRAKRAFWQKIVINQKYFVC